MMKRKHVVILLIFLLIIPSVIAQTTLRPGRTDFTVQAIVLSEFSVEGDLDYITAKWDANYFDNSERTIGVKCFLNCPNPRDDIDANCVTDIDGSAIRSCTYTGLTGQRSCTIQNPPYKYTLQLGFVNNITCKMWDPADPSIPFVPYPNVTFRPIDYSLSVSQLAVNVGEEFNFPLSVVSLGLIPSAYTFNITEILEPKVLFIDRTIGFTEKLMKGEAGRFTPTVIYLIARSTNLEVMATANSDPVICNTNDDCSYLEDAKCIKPESGPNKCWKRIDLQLKAGKTSLADFDIFGFFQIMTMAVIVLIFIKFKKF